MSQILMPCSLFFYSGQQIVAKVEGVPFSVVVLPSTALYIPFHRAQRIAYTLIEE